MDSEQQLEQWFSSGRLVRPGDGPGFRDLVAAVLSLAGGPRREWGPHPERLVELIGEADHYVMVLLDGVGRDSVELLPQSSFLRSHTVEHIEAVFPSTTAAALTTLGTALWPASHGIVGWWMYLGSVDVSIVTLPFIERGTERSLHELGIGPLDVYRTPSVWPELKMTPRSVVPKEYADSDYTRYVTGGTERLGYQSITEAVERAYAAVKRSRGPSFTYVYIPDIDSVMHEQGTRSAEADRLLRSVDALLDQLAVAVAGRARFVGCADHGQVDIPRKNVSVLVADDPLARMLLAQPSGEARVPYFHVRAGREQAFMEQFADRFGAQYVLLTPECAERLRLFGPSPLDPIARRRLGTAIGISAEPRKLFVEPCGDCFSHVGAHGGLLAGEMWVPLVLA